MDLMPTLSSISAFATSALEHEGFMAAYGVIAWYAFHYAIDKQKGRARKGFANWRHEKATDVLLTVIVAAGMVIFDDELIDAYNNFAEIDIEIQRWMYLLPGLVTGRVLKWVYKEDTTTKVT